MNHFLGAVPWYQDTTDRSENFNWLIKPYCSCLSFPFIYLSLLCFLFFHSPPFPSQHYTNSVVAFSLFLAWLKLQCPRRDTLHYNYNDCSPTAVPSEWDIECISSLLSHCGEKFCCEVLGNKAINGRTRELSYLLFHIWQVRYWDVLYFTKGHTLFYYK